MGTLWSTIFGVEAAYASCFGSYSLVLLSMLACLHLVYPRLCLPALLFVRAEFPCFVESEGFYRDCLVLVNAVLSLPIRMNNSIARSYFNRSSVIERAFVENRTCFSQLSFLCHKSRSACLDCV